MNGKSFFRQYGNNIRDIEKNRWYFENLIFMKCMHDEVMSKGEELL